MGKWSLECRVWGTFGGKHESGMLCLGTFGGKHESGMLFLGTFGGKHESGMLCLGVFWRGSGVWNVVFGRFLARKYSLECRGWGTLVGQV